MNTNQFYKLSHELADADLKRLGFTKASKSSWQLKSDMFSLKLNIKLDKWGWHPHYGSAFVYELLPYDKKGNFLSDSYEQLRLHELKDYDKSLLSKAQKTLKTFSSKVTKDPDDDFWYNLRVKKWTDEEVNDILAEWYYFYDSEDVANWYSTLRGALVNYLEAFGSKVASHEPQLKGGESTYEYKEMKVTIDPDTGEAKIDT